MLYLKHLNGSLRTKAKCRYSRKCNLCGNSFTASIPHRYFCDACKEGSDLYRFHDWLPDVPEGWDEDAGAVERTNAA